MSRCLSAVLLMLLVPALRADSTEKELAKLRGKWAVEVIEENGVMEPPEEAARFLVTITGTTITVRLGDREETMNYKIDASQAPPHIDLMPNYGTEKGRVTKGIYEVGDGTLRICGRPRGERPKEIESGLGNLLLVLRRQP